MVLGNKKVKTTRYNKKVKNETIWIKHNITFNIEGYITIIEQNVIYHNLVKNYF